MRTVALAAVVGALLGGGAVAAADAARGQGWTVTAEALSAEGAISAEDDGHTYAVPLDVAWQDADGAYHESGRPACLPPTGQVEGPVRLRAVPLDAGGVRSRRVVFVECL